jgi:hypothetical protein
MRGGAERSGAERSEAGRSGAKRGGAERSGAERSEAGRSGATARGRRVLWNNQSSKLCPFLMECEKAIPCKPLPPLQLVAFHHQMYLTNLATINVLS